MIIGIFPRSYERGPIEALPFRRESSAQHAFRVPMNAAPLKLVIAAASCSAASSFPRSYERGPIEASNSRSFLLGGFLLSAFL